MNPLKSLIADAFVIIERRTEHGTVERFIQTLNKEDEMAQPKKPKNPQPPPPPPGR